MEDLTPIEIDPNTFLREHNTLPALPEVVAEIQQIAQSGSQNVGAAVELISRDPAIVAQILKVINSAYYGLSREIDDLKFAVAYMGLGEIYRIVLSFYVVDAIKIKEPHELKQFWSHSFFTALSSKLLGKKFEPLLSSDELWSPAILHDIGKLVYLKFYPDHYKVLNEYSKKEGCMFSDAEKHFPFPKSSYMGALLCKHWRLPHNVSVSCEHHGLEDLRNIKADKPSHGIRRIICLANLITTISTDNLNENLKSEIIDAVRKDMDYTEAEFLALMGEIYEVKLEVDKLNT